MRTSQSHTIGYLLFIIYLFNIILILSVVLTGCFCYSAVVAIAVAFAVAVAVAVVIIVSHIWSKLTLKSTESTICMLTNWIRPFRSNQFARCANGIHENMVKPIQTQSNQIRSDCIGSNQINSSKFESTSNHLHFEIPFSY